MLGGGGGRYFPLPHPADYNFTLTELDILVISDITLGTWYYLASKWFINEAQIM